MKRANSRAMFFFPVAGIFVFIIFEIIWYFLMFYPDIPHISDTILMVLMGSWIAFFGMLLVFNWFRTMDTTGLFFEEGGKDDHIPKVDELR